MAPILIEWKELAAFARRYLKRKTLCKRTLQRWHYGRLKIPFAKTYASQQGRVIISEETFAKWLDIIRFTRKK